MRLVVVVCLLLFGGVLLSVTPSARQIPASDTDPPHLVDLDFAPTQINTAFSGQFVTVTLHITDDLSGLHDGSGSVSDILFYSPSGAQHVWGPFDSDHNLISGDILDGIYVLIVQWPRYCETGTWKINRVWLFDNVGNNKLLEQSDLAALGFPTELVVTDEVYTAFLPVVMRANP